MPWRRSRASIRSMPPSAQLPANRPRLSLLVSRPVGLLTGIPLDHDQLAARPNGVFHRAGGSFLQEHPWEGQRPPRRANLRPQTKSLAENSSGFVPRSTARVPRRGRTKRIAKADYLDGLPRRSACNLSSGVKYYTAFLRGIYVESVGWLPTVAEAQGILRVPQGRIAAAELN